VQDESGHRQLLSPVLPGPGEDIHGSGVTVVGGFDIGLQAAFPVIIGVTEDESIGGRISLHHLFHKGHVTSRHVVLVGRQNKNAAGAGDKRGIAALFFTGEPGQRAIIPPQAATGNSTAATGKGQGLGFTTSLFYFLFL